MPLSMEKVRVIKTNFNRRLCLPVAYGNSDPNIQTFWRLEKMTTQMVRLWTEVRFYYYPSSNFTSYKTNNVINKRNIYMLYFGVIYCVCWCFYHIKDVISSSVYVSTCLQQIQIQSCEHHVWCFCWPVHTLMVCNKVFKSSTFMITLLNLVIALLVALMAAAVNSLPEFFWFLHCPKSPW